MHACQLCVPHETFFSTFFRMKLFYLLQDLLPFLFFSLIIFFYCLFITRILSNKQKLQYLLFFHHYESRATMCESILKILSTFTFFCDLAYETLIQCWFIFFYLIHKGFCPTHEFVFCNQLDRIRRQNFGTKVA